MGGGCLFCFIYVTENSSFCLFLKSIFLFIYLAILDLNHAGSLFFIVACGPFCFFFFKISSFLWLYRAFVASGGLSVVAVCGLVIAVPSLVV